MKTTWACWPGCAAACTSSVTLQQPPVCTAWTGHVITATVQEWLCPVLQVDITQSEPIERLPQGHIERRHQKHALWYNSNIKSELMELAITPILCVCAFPCPLHTALSGRKVCKCSKLTAGRWTAAFYAVLRLIHFCKRMLFLSIPSL